MWTKVFWIFLPKLRFPNGNEMPKLSFTLGYYYITVEQNVVVTALMHLRLTLNASYRPQKPICSLILQLQGLKNYLIYVRHFFYICTRYTKRCPNPNPGRNVRNRPHPKTTLSPWCYLPNHKIFGYSEVFIWFRDGTIRSIHQEVWNSYHWYFSRKWSWHSHDYMSNCGLQLEINSGPILVFFFLNLFDRNIIGIISDLV